MDLEETRYDEGRFGAYVEGLVSVIGHADRARPLKDYCSGLLVSSGRRNAEAMAGLTVPGHASAQHQSLLHFVGQGGWSDEAVLGKVREMVLPVITRAGPIEAWIIDDTSFPKKGKHSVGVARQYCGQLGKEDNCQVAVSLSLASAHASLPVAWRLYLPKSWTEDPERLAKAGVPDDVAFATKPEIALEQIRWACEAGLPRGTVLMDSGYGADTRLREGVTALGLSYVAGIKSNTTVWGPGTGPLPPEKRQGRGRPAKRLRRDETHRPQSVEALARGLPKRAWKRIAWREGSAESLASRFARVRVRAAHRDEKRTQCRPEEWLLIEWPMGEKEPTRYWLSTLGEDIAFDRLVEEAKLRWRIERDFQELKQEVGLGHYEGRGWRGFHHHATLSIAAYGFLVSERETIPPSQARRSRSLPPPRLPEGRPPRRASAQARAPRAELDHNHATAPRGRDCESTAEMSVLRATVRQDSETEKRFMTQ